MDPSVNVMQKEKCLNRQKNTSKGFFKNLEPPIMEPDVSYSSFGNFRGWRDIRKAPKNLAPSKNPNTLPAPYHCMNQVKKAYETSSLSRPSELKVAWLKIASWKIRDNSDIQRSSTNWVKLSLVSLRFRFNETYIKWDLKLKIH